METKDQMRERLRKLRQHLSPHQVEQLSAQITESLIKEISWHGVKTLHSYLSIKDQGEVDTSEFLRYIWHHHPHIATFAPVMHGSSMQSVPINASTAIAVNRFGIPEPVGEQLLHEPNLDLIVVPLLGFDASRHRLGYGHGHYDRFLTSHHQTKSIGLAFEIAKVDQIPAQPHDRKLSMIVTESSVYKA